MFAFALIVQCAFSTPDISSFARVYEEDISPQKLRLAGAKCPLGEAPFIPEVPLQHCAGYQMNSCCNADAAKRLAEEVNVDALMECPGCKANIMALRCAMVCSPWQHHFFNVELTGARKTLRICRSFCTDLFYSCEKVSAWNNSLREAEALLGASFDAIASFCTEQFKSADGLFSIEIVNDGGDCFGHTHVDSIAVCDPFSRDRLTHILDRLEMHRKTSYFSFTLLVLLLLAVLGYICDVLPAIFDWTRRGDYNAGTHGSFI